MPRCPSTRTLQETFKDTSGLAWVLWVGGGAGEPPRRCDSFLHVSHLCLGEATVAVVAYLRVVLWNPGLLLSRQAHVGQAPGTERERAGEQEARRKLSNDMHRSSLISALGPSCSAGSSDERFQFPCGRFWNYRVISFSCLSSEHK